MKPHEIEELLSQLENGEISDDGGSEDEDEIYYYVNREQIQQELEYMEDLAADAADAGNDENIDPPLLNDCDNETTDTNQSVKYIGTLRSIVWKVKKMNLLKEAFNFKGNAEYPQIIMDLATPFQFFSYFFDEELLFLLQEESNKYGFQKNPNFSDPVTLLELRQFLGILIFTSVYHYPSVRAYWSNEVKFWQIAQTMSLNRFEKIRQIFHMNDDTNHLPADHPQHDRLHKIRPVIDFLNKRFTSVSFDHRLSLDEQMCATKIGHFMKQYLPNKPHK